MCEHESSAFLLLGFFGSCLGCVNAKCGVGGRGGRRGGGAGKWKYHLGYGKEADIRAKMPEREAANVGDSWKEVKIGVKMGSSGMGAQMKVI